MRTTGKLDRALRGRVSRFEDECGLQPLRPGSFIHGASASRATASLYFRRDFFRISHAANFMAYRPENAIFPRPSKPLTRILHLQHSPINPPV